MGRSLKPTGVGETDFAAATAFAGEVFCTTSFLPLDPQEFKKPKANNGGKILKEMYFMN
jgi:hypothetical protein